MDLQPTLTHELVLLRPLLEDDFDDLYQVASDKLLWEQHPNSDRYQKEVFEDFFEKALDSKGAFVIIDQKNKNIIGSSRFYDFNSNEKSIIIGYTFIDRKFWGTAYNKTIKKIMLDYAFESIDTVYFHVGKTNFRSQKAMEKLGGKIVSYTTAPNGTTDNPVYAISKEEWFKN